MTATFEELPFDVHFYIALNLDIEDVVHLSQLCRQLHALIGERVLCRRMVEVDTNTDEDLSYKLICQ